MQKPNTCNAESLCYDCGKATALLCLYMRSRDPVVALEAICAKYEALSGTGAHKKAVVHYRITDCPLYEFGPLPMLTTTKREKVEQPKPKTKRGSNCHHEIPDLTRERYLFCKRQGLTDEAVLKRLGLKYNTWKASLMLAKRQWGLKNYRYNHMAQRKEMGI